MPCLSLLIVLRYCFYDNNIRVQPLPTNIILASSSAFRKSLLERLQIVFSCISPDIDESQYADEAAEDYVKRLARQKAEAVSRLNSDAVVIGSDQCALLDGVILGKPYTHQNALRQLKNAQGKTVIFHTGLCVLQQSSGFCKVEDILYEVEFRQLNDGQLEHYLRVEQPYQCAGSFKSEAYGISLFSRMRGDDPTALIGLPLIRLTAMLEDAGIRVI